MQKMVNGKLVELTDTEVVEVDALWAEEENSALVNFRTSTSLTRIELALGLINAAILTQADGEDFAAGVIPSAMSALIAQMPAEDQPLVRLTMRGATEFPRVHAFWDALVALGLYTDEQIDAVFGWGDEA